MRVAVTGATGFIGRHVLEELARRGVETIAVVRSSTASPPALPGTRMACMDIHAAPSDAYDLIGRPDALIHLAWGGLPNYRSLHHFEQELPAQYRFLRGLVEAGLSTLVVAGTCFEYGMQSGPLNESLETRPNNPYGFAKDMLRRQLEFLKAAYPFALTWTRLFYLYGEGQAENSLYPQLRKAVQRGDKTFPMSGGEQLRDYLPVSEVARALVALTLRQEDIGTINLCSGQPVSVRNLIEGWIRENGWSISPNLGHYPYPDHEPLAFWGSSKKLSSLIGNAS
ncbi:MAG: epimerase [Hydrogenophilales bacterium CG17_big_fil_post_rev_8_21_14_2_50_63_12]|nr:MAG: epimerase [Hydrogenophilales bacterium CG17_big_fil_post_rev_8_21_14_2_50_63_12]PIX97956.1 MAG: epimerase [Hydrogenophilales bacterium CG_4_10_14_3_um_filter_63_21]